MLQFWRKQSMFAVLTQQKYFCCIFFSFFLRDFFKQSYGNADYVNELQTEVFPCRSRLPFWSVPVRMGQLRPPQPHPLSLAPTWGAWADWTPPAHPCTAMPCITRAVCPPHPHCTLVHTRPISPTWPLSGQADSRILFKHLTIIGVFPLLFFL